MQRLDIHQIQATGSRDATTYLRGDGTWATPSGGGAGGALTLLKTVTLSASAPTVSFAGTDIPSAGYDHLRLLYRARGTDTVQLVRALRVAFNGDTADANYASYYIQDFIETVNNGVDPNARYIGLVPMASATANVPGSGEVTINDYASTTWFKTAQGRSSAMDIPAGIRQSISETLWKNTAAINSIDLTLPAGSFAAGSRFWLYGISA